MSEQGGESERPGVGSWVDAEDFARHNALLLAREALEAVEWVDTEDSIIGACPQVCAWNCAPGHQHGSDCLRERALAGIKEALGE